MAKAIISSTPADIGNQQVHFNREKFDDLIYDKGYAAFIDRAVQCPCQSRATGKALPDCQNCGGVGWFYIDRQSTVLWCSSISNRTKYEVWTVSNAGTVNISTRPEDKLGWMDKVILTELDSWFSQSYYLKLLTDGSYFTFLTYEPTSVFDVFIFAGSNDPLGYLTPDLFTILGNKILVPAATIAGFGISGITDYCISLRYTHNPAYYIIDINRDLVKQRVDQCFITPSLTPAKTNLPLNAIGRRAHFVLDAANFAGNNLFDNTPTRTPINYDI